MELSRKTKIEGNTQIDTIVTSVCTKCRKLQARCKCRGSTYEEVTNEYKTELNQKAPDGHYISALSAEESKRIYDEKMAIRAAKRANSVENMKIAAADEDDADEEKAKEKAELEKWEAERAAETSRNVDELLALKKSLAADKKSPIEIKSAVNELKETQKKRGRPAADAIKNPVKNPLTGEFESSAE